MRAQLAGLAFDVRPEARLCPAERDLLAALAGRGCGDATGFALDLVEAPPWPEGMGGDPLQPAPVTADDGAILRVGYPTFSARLDLLAGRGELSRSAEVQFPLAATLRAGLTGRLALGGGLPIHAAGAVVDGRGVVFFGPSGAGKTTLARACPWPVLSDELVAVRGPSWTLHGSGFWGELDPEGRPLGPVPLAALVELGRGCDRLEPLDPVTAYRRLLDVLMLPVAPALWRPAVATLARLVAEVPVWRLAWSPVAPRWRALAESLLTQSVPRHAHRRSA